MLEKNTSNAISYRWQRFNRLQIGYVKKLLAAVAESFTLRFGFPRFLRRFQSFFRIRKNARNALDFREGL